MRFLARTKNGKIASCVTLVAFASMYLQYWLTMWLSAPGVDTPRDVIWVLQIILSLFSILAMCLGGLYALITFVRNTDRCVLTAIAGLFGILGLFMVIGELVLPLLYLTH
jgi:nitrate/nitrite transporter NarK